MPIDVTKERLCTLADGARSIPGQPHTCTLIRWWKKGRLGIRLEVVKFGRRTFTSHEALSRFANAVAEVESRVNPTPQIPIQSRYRKDSSRRQREIEAAEQFCRSRGI